MIWWKVHVEAATIDIQAAMGDEPRAKRHLEEALENLHKAIDALEEDEELAR